MPKNFAQIPPWASIGGLSRYVKRGQLGRSDTSASLGRFGCTWATTYNIKPDSVHGHRYGHLGRDE